MALQALLAVDAGEPSHVATPRLLRSSDLDARDRAFVTGLVAGTLRARRTLDHALIPYLDRPLSRLDADVREGLRLGAYQLRAGVAPHAAVSETVDAVAARRPRARGFVNAVLRRLADVGEWPVPEGDTDTDVGIRTSHPDWIVRRLRASFGDVQAQAILDLDNQAPTMMLRPNPLRADPLRADAEALRAELEAAGGSVNAGTIVPEALAVRGVGDPSVLDVVASGRASPQDEASQAVAEAVVGAVLRARGEDGHSVVVDLAAAPGGKACAIAERLPGRSMIVAADIAQQRLRWVTDAIARLDLTNVVVLCSDGSRLGLRDGVADAVLVDAPCSGLGVLRRRPESRWRIEQGDLGAMAERQRALLVEGARVLRHGGTLVYSVCTLSDEETLDIDSWLAREHGELEAIRIVDAPWRDHGRGSLLLPTDAGTDGMYVLALQKSTAIPAGTLG